jgi:hypothetical protein
VTRAWKVAVLVCLAIAVFLGALVGLWFFLQPTLLPGTDEIRRIGCDWRSHVIANVPKDGGSYEDYATSIDCTVDDESVAAPTCAAVLKAYLGAAGHRGGNVMINVSKAKVIHGKPAFEHECRQVLAPDGTVVSSMFDVQPAGAPPR